MTTTSNSAPLPKKPSKPSVPQLETVKDAIHLVNNYLGSLDSTEALADELLQLCKSNPDLLCGFDDVSNYVRKAAKYRRRDKEISAMFLEKAEEILSEEENSLHEALLDELGTDAYDAYMDLMREESL
jgi:hypothetical protein